MPRARASDGRKAAIVDAAARLFGERGYEAVGMDDIGAAVEISGPSLYWHFPSKQALLDAVVLTTVERFATANESLLAADPAASFEDFVRLETALMLDHPGDAATTLSEANRVSPECRAAATSAQARSEHVARTTLARLNPSLDADPDAAGLRLLTQLGPFVAVSRERRGHGSAPRRAIARARLEALIVPSVLALAATPPAERPAPTPATTWQPQRSRREAILAGARQIFRDRGFRSVGLGDIGEAAGISAATVYHYFAGGKTEILQAAWERETMRLVAGALSAVERAESAGDAVDRLARAHVEVMLGCLDLVNVVYRELQDELAPAGVWADNRRLLVDLWAGALREVRPGLTEAERLALVDMSFAASVQAALAVEGRAEWLDDIARQIAAFAKG